MPYKDKEKMKEWREKNKQKIKEQQKEYNEEHKEKIKEQQKEYQKEWRQTDQGKKSQRIHNWKRSGLICEDYDKLYEYYLNTNDCDKCGIELVEGLYGANKKCMDHNHKTGIFRNILCNTCNCNSRDYESD